MKKIIELIDKFSTKSLIYFSTILFILFYILFALLSFGVVIHYYDIYTNHVSNELFGNIVAFLFYNLLFFSMMLGIFSLILNKLNKLVKSIINKFFKKLNSELEYLKITENLKKIMSFIITVCFVFIFGVKDKFCDLYELITANNEFPIMSDSIDIALNISLYWMFCTLLIIHNSLNEVFIDKKIENKIIKRKICVQNRRRPIRIRK